MDDVYFEGQEYRLRAGPPMPISAAGSFVLHTFLAEKRKVDIIACTETLPASSDFRGQGGSLMSASFSRLNIKDGNIFSGKKVYKPTFVQEDAEI
jgi:hypothetical protein